MQYFSPLREGDTYWHAPEVRAAEVRAPDFSPLREGDTYWHRQSRSPSITVTSISVPFAKGTPTGTAACRNRDRWVPKFQSPSRRGHLLAPPVTIAFNNGYFYFSPLREGDTYWHGGLPKPGSMGSQISVPFAKGTPTGTDPCGCQCPECLEFQSPSRRGHLLALRIQRLYYRPLRISVPFAKGTPTGTAGAWAGTEAGI